MGRTVSNGPGYAPDDEFDPRIDDFVLNKRDYLHFDLRLSEDERKSFSPSASDILQNAFWPLIGYTIEERRARKDDDGNLVFVPKERPIKFGSHKDAAILQYYAKSLSKDYEKLLGGKNFAPSILAYRGGIGNNIDHAKSLFDEIRIRRDCTALAMDISGFFDNIRHDVLYSHLCAVRGGVRLGDVDFYIFQRMTKFEWVESDTLEQSLGVKYGRSGRICFPRDFRNLIRKKGGVQSNPYAHGIPQGTPLSGLYANISLLEFDQAMTNLAQSLGGSYRRYSDDIALVFPNSVCAKTVIAGVEAELGSIGLAVSKKKTEIAHFESGVLSGEEAKPFQYLGFTFDGQRTLIRQSSLNRYYTKMNRGVRAKVHAAKKKDIPSNEIFMRELFRKYTHFGQTRNFPRYAYRASKVLNAPEIRAQLRRHMNIFKKMVRRAVSTIY